MGPAQLCRGRGALCGAALVLLASLADAVTTTLGSWLGLREAGPLASLLLPELGPLYWPLQALALQGVYAMLLAAGLGPGRAALAAGSGPLAASLGNAMQIWVVAAGAG